MALKGEAKKEWAKRWYQKKKAERLARPVTMDDVLRMFEKQLAEEAARGSAPPK